MAFVFDIEKCPIDAVEPIPVTHLISDPTVPDPPDTIRNHDPYRPPPFPPIGCATPDSGGGDSNCTSIVAGSTSIYALSPTAAPTLNLDITKVPDVCTYIVDIEIGVPVCVADMVVRSATVGTTNSFTPALSFTVEQDDTNPCMFYFDLALLIPSASALSIGLAIRTATIDTAACDAPPSLSFDIEEDLLTPGLWYLDLAIVIPDYSPDLHVRSQTISTVDCDAPPTIDFVIEQHPTIKCRWYFDLAIAIPDYSPDLHVRSQTITTSDCGTDPTINFVIEQHPTIKCRWYFDLAIVIPDWHHTFIGRTVLIQTTDCASPPAVEFAITEHETIPCRFYYDLTITIPDYKPDLFVRSQTIVASGCCAEPNVELVVERDVTNPCLWFIDLAIVVPSCCSSTTSSGDATTLLLTMPANSSSDIFATSNSNRQRYSVALNTGEKTSATPALRAFVEGLPVELSVVNLTPYAIEVYSIDLQGVEIKHMKLRGFSNAIEQVLYGHPIRIRSVTGDSVIEIQALTKDTEISVFF